MFSNRDGGPLDITNLRERVWRPALRRAKLRARTLYQTRHTFATLMLELGESPQWLATQLGHTNAEMVYRRYHRFIPNLRGRDGALAAKGLADEGLLWSLDGHSTQPRGYGETRNPLSFGAADRIRTGDVPLGKSIGHHQQRHDAREMVDLIVEVIPDDTR